MDASILEDRAIEALIAASIRRGGRAAASVIRNQQ
jgi:hypothetical protein